jgi:RimJ/RimL family protein N-acetyltransferase
MVELELLEFRERLAAGRSAQLAVVHEAANALVGYVGVDAIDPQEGTGEVSYWTAAGCRCLGIASSALHVLSPWALYTFGLVRLVAYVDPANIPSQCVAEKAGYRRGCVRQTRLGPAVTYILGADG